MLRLITEKWWMAVLRGLGAILFGVLVFVWPGISLFVLVVLFGALALVDGATAIGVAIAGRRAGGTVLPLVLAGILGIGIGIVTLFWPAITAIALLALIAAWAIVRGVFEIIAAVRLRRLIEHEWLLGLAGVLSVVFGVLLVFNPQAGALAVLWLIAAYAIVFGVLMVAFGLRLKRLRDALDAAARPQVAI